MKRIITLELESERFHARIVSAIMENVDTLFKAAIVAAGTDFHATVAVDGEVKREI